MQTNFLGKLIGTWIHFEFRYFQAAIGNVYLTVPVTILSKYLNTEYLSKYLLDY